jgi:hypothetical protein
MRKVANFSGLPKMNCSKTGFGKRIDKAETSDECRVVRQEMYALLKRLNQKLKKLEDEELEIGLNYRGRAGFDCHCGSRVDKTKRYFGRCRECNRGSCAECLSTCDICGTADICNEAENFKPCLFTCAGCEECRMCPECRSDAKKCENCDEPTCDDCLRDLAFSDYCPECYDYLNTDCQGNRFSKYR